MGSPVLVHAMPHPLKAELLTAEVPEGLTLAEILGNPPSHFQVWIGDVHVPRERWRFVRPKAGAIVTVKALAHGGGSGGGGDKAVRTVLQIGVLAAALWVPGALGLAARTLSATANSALMGVVGSMAVNALVPPPTPAPQVGGNSFDRLKAITGTQNRVNAFGAVPRVYGRHRIFPPFAAKPFTEIVGKDQYLRLLLCLGYGPLTVTDIKIGETPIDDFNDVEYEVTSSPTDLFSKDVVEDGEAVTMKLNEVFTRTTAPGAAEFSFDMLFPLGMYTADDEGDHGVLRIRLEIEYRAAGSADPWVKVSTLDSITASGNRDVAIEDSYTPDGGLLGSESQRALWAIYPDGSFTLQAMKLRAFRTGLRWAFPSVGQWEVRVRYTQRGSIFGWSDPVPAAPASAHTFVITASRSILESTVPFQSDFVYLAMRIRATDQFNGVVDTVNCIAESHLPVWTGSEFEVQLTRNPAWIYLDIAAGSATERAIDKSARAQLADLKAWADRCTAAGREFNYVFDARTTVFEAMRDVASIGRASFDVRNGKYTVVEDLPDLPPVQVFTPRNSWDFSGSRAFQDLPHALRARFVNPEKGWQQDERVVYDDGYGPDNATRFETVELRGITDPDQAWSEARYILATARLRAETFTLKVDVENHVARRGDVVLVSHDTIQTTAAWGRLKAVAGAQLTLDEPVTMLAGVLYGIRLRKADGTIVLKNVTTAAGTSAVINMSSGEAGIAEGDLWVFGEHGIETERCKVLRVRALEDMAAQLELVPDPAGVYAADSLAPPPFESEIPDPADRRPPAPTAYHIASDESVLIRASDGSLTSRILIAFGFTSATLPAGGTVEVRFRDADDTVWEAGPTVPADAGEISLLPVIDGRPYEIQLRAVAAAGLAGPWGGVITHTAVGKTTPPPDVEALFINGDVLTWTYPGEPLDFKGFLVRYHAGLNPSWDTSIAAHPGVIAGPPFTLEDMPGGDVTLLVKGVDSSGIESVNPARVFVDLGAASVENIVATEDFAAAGFPGTKTNCSVVAGDLVADTQSLAWAGSSAAPAWTGNNAALAWTAAYEAMSYEVSYAPPGDMTGTDTNLILAPRVQGLSWSIEYRTHGAGSFWSAYESDPAWTGDSHLLWAGAGPWRAWPGNLGNVQRETFDFRLDIAGGSTQGIVYDFAIVTDVPDVRETLNDVALGLTGTRLPLQKDYRAIKSVAVILQDSSTDAVAVKRVDLSTAGPLLQAYTAAGAHTTAIIDARVEGY
jgi:hypothetical protein